MTFNSISCIEKDYKWLLLRGFYFCYLCRNNIIYDIIFLHEHSHEIKNKAYNLDLHISEYHHLYSNL